MSKLLIQINTDLVASGLASVCDLNPGKLEALQNIENYIGGISAGAHNADLSASTNAISSAATLTVSAGGSTAAETCSIANVVLTARASAPAANEFVISATAATQAANMAACINASASLAGIVSAVAVGGVVTITSLIPGKASNGLQLSESLTNVALVAFAGGSGSLSAVYSSK